jgi:hypothetical protein
LFKKKEGEMMLSRMGKRFSYTNVLMTFALVFAMSGGAFAAGKYLITSTKQISPKILAALKGKPGAAGAQGSAGPTGPVGSAGARGETGPAGQNGAQGEKGAPGENGAPGKDGFNGSNGVSVMSKEFSGSQGACKEGGSEFTAASNSKTYACNGKEGKDGSPWTAGGTLPVGSSETGQWSFFFVQGEGAAPLVTASISFPVPLEKALAEANSHFIGPEEGEGEPKANLPDGCSGNVKEPKAASGNLCIFTRTVEGLKTGPLLASLTINDVETGEVRAGRSGAYLSGFISGAQAGDQVIGIGDWVVTG